MAIIITRIVAQARRKHEPPPKKPPPQPYIPVHFEDDPDDSDDDFEYFRNRLYDEPKPVPQKAPAGNFAANAARTQKTIAEPFTPKPELSSFITPIKTFPVPPKAAMPVLHEQKDFTLNLNHLSPLKQAVVMAEVLGKPKGMTGE